MRAGGERLISEIINLEYDGTLALTGVPAVAQVGTITPT